MKRAHDFDSVLDCQEVFRKILEAFANPGRVVDISASAKKLSTTLAAYIAVAAALIDNETAFCVVGDAVLSELVQQFTYGRAADLSRSDYVFSLCLCDSEQIRSILSSVPAGTMADPHASGTVLVRVETFEEKAGCRLKGPGIDGETVAPLGAYAAKWLKARRDLGIEYPCGVDLAFLTDDGRIMAAPRLVQLAG
jgi:alpha-D-ribose 1-methylphosphonate 5-triphosphate synthase subunit PhnH